jgi:G3E family GTPase
MSMKEHCDVSETHAQTSTRLPAYILVGFLGSGKTTVLGHLLEWCVEQGLRPGLVINEYGDVSIDGEALRQEGLPLTELSEGCICCTASEELVPALLDIARQPKVDLIFLEATGLADPLDLLDTLTDPQLWACVEVGGIISVIDSQRFTQLAHDLVLARHQVEYADVLVMNKCDLISREWQEALLASLPTLAPQARIFLAEDGQPAEGVEALLRHALEVGRTRQRAPVKRSAEHHCEHGQLQACDEVHEHGEAHGSMHTVSLPLQEPLLKTQFAHFLESLPPTIYRAKGFVTFPGESCSYIFQYVPGYIFLKRFPVQNQELLRGVFIGTHFEHDWLAKQLADCRAEMTTREQTLGQGRLYEAGAER